MESKLVSTFNISEAQSIAYGLNYSFDEACDEFIAKDIECFLTELDSSKQHEERPVLALLHSTFNEVNEHFEFERWLTLTDDRFFDKKAKGCWILSENSEDDFHKLYTGSITTDEVTIYINSKIGDVINNWNIPFRSQLKFLTELPKETTPFNITNGRFCLHYNYIYLYDDSIRYIDCDLNCWTQTDSGISLPFLPFNKKASSGKPLFLELIKKGLSPKVLANSKSYQLLLAIFNRKYIGLFENDRIAAKAFLQCEFDLINAASLTKALLTEDTVRADIAPYHQKMLKDTAQGHWSLWQDMLKIDNGTAIELPSKLVARNPQSSINDGVVGIDFGTKSTVVVYQKDNVNIHPMRVGTGDLSKQIAAYHYENPTIMEFNDLSQFISDYQAKANKPFTRWQDLTISHTAQNSMLGCDASQFNTFLDELKQWAGDSNRKLKVVGKEGTVFDLPPFLALKDTDFNPIEIYAYYLGLYINNQNNGIFLDYILSFPVTYEMPIRDKIIESFENGLRKSLPEELGEEWIAKLSVAKGASEPAAYALVALQSFEFDPSDDERIFYSVFDFGGGTTDFDFGLFREANGTKERRYDYVIEHFGAGGDKFLGGENLLELLAFEIFKSNKETLLSKGIQFEKHPEKDNFAGSEQLLSHSQEAKVNTKTLCEKLRPFWEGHNEQQDALSQGSLSINLSDVHGTIHAALELNVSEEELNTVLRNRIERGVINFFNALRLAFSNTNHSLHDIDQIQIFLAGNASLSHFVTELFEHHIALQHEDMGLTMEDVSRFKLFPPLGIDNDNVEKPTGKTGVAFGLIESREGGSIKVIDHNIKADDIRFKYYLGESRKGRFKPIVDRETAFNRWIEFIDATCEKFELFYTDQPFSSTGQALISDDSIKKRIIKLDMTDDNASVFIRIVSPTRIEYVIGQEAELSNGVYLSNIQSIELS